MITIYIYAQCQSKNHFIVIAGPFLVVGHNTSLLDQETIPYNLYKHTSIITSKLHKGASLCV